jgi:hypothetical protein
LTDIAKMIKLGELIFITLGFENIPRSGSRNKLPVFLGLIKKGSTGNKSAVNLHRAFGRKIERRQTGSVSVVS